MGVRKRELHFPTMRSSGSVEPDFRLEGWEDVFMRLGGSSGGYPPSALSRARLTMAASITFGLRLLPPQELENMVRRDGRGKGGRLKIWIVGAREPMEGELARGGHLAEPLALLLPPALAAKGVEIVLVGPEMTNWAIERANRAASTRSANSTLLIKSATGTLHGLKRPGSLPDFCVLFNSGIGTLLWPLVEQWLPTISMLLGMPDVPVFCTCFDEHEARGEESVLGNAFKTKYLLESRRNPLGYVSPIEAVAANSRLRLHDAESLVLKAQADADEVAKKRQELAVPLPDQKYDKKAKPPPVKEGSRSNKWIKWIRGSEFGPEGLAGEATDKATEMVKMCAKMFAFKNMDAWLEDIKASSDMETSDVFSSGDGIERLAANVMLMAEATDETSIALIAYQKGALDALAKLLTAVHNYTEKGSGQPRALVRGCSGRGTHPDRSGAGDRQHGGCNTGSRGLVDSSERRRRKDASAPRGLCQHVPGRIHQRS